MIRIIVGNSLTELPKLEPESVHMVGTSPPYWNLRDYGLPPSWWGGDPRCDHVEYGEETITREVRKGVGLSELSKRYRGGGKKAGQVPKVQIVRGSCERCGAWHGVLGLEPTPELFIQHLADIFDQVWRVLRPDGTLWVNMGDSYAGSGRGGDSGGTSTLEGSKDTQEESKRVVPRDPRDTQQALGLDNRNPAIRGSALRDLPAGPDRALHSCRDIGTRLLRQMRGTMAAHHGAIGALRRISWKRSPRSRQRRRTRHDAKPRREPAECDARRRWNHDEGNRDAGMVADLRM